MGRFVSALENITIEPLCFVYALAFSVLDVIRQDFIYQVGEPLWKKIIKQNTNSFKIQTICMNECGVDGTACAEIVQGNVTLKVDIEKTTTRYIQRYTLIETLVPAIMCLFVGPYSDEHGRKLPIVSQIIDHHTHKVHWVM